MSKEEEIKLANEQLKSYGQPVRIIGIAEPRYQALMEIAQAVAEADTVYYDFAGQACVFCGSGDSSPTVGIFKHTSDCLPLKARALLAQLPKKEEKSDG